MNARKVQCLMMGLTLLFSIGAEAGQVVGKMRFRGPTAEAAQVATKISAKVGSLGLKTFAATPKPTINGQQTMYEIKFRGAQETVDWARKIALKTIHENGLSVESNKTRGSLGHMLKRGAFGVGVGAFPLFGAAVLLLDGSSNEPAELLMRGLLGGIVGFSVGSLPMLAADNIHRNIPN